MAVVPVQLSVHALLLQGPTWHLASQLHLQVFTELLQVPIAELFHLELICQVPVPFILLIRHHLKLCFKRVILLTYLVHSELHHRQFLLHFFNPYLVLLVLPLKRLSFCFCHLFFSLDVLNVIGLIYHVLDRYGANAFNFYRFEAALKTLYFALIDQVFNVDLLFSRLAVYAFYPSLVDCDEPGGLLGYVLVLLAFTPIGLQVLANCAVHIGRRDL